MSNETHQMRKKSPFVIGLSGTTIGLSRKLTENPNRRRTNVNQLLIHRIVSAELVLIEKCIFPFTGEVTLDPLSLNYELVSEYELFFKVSDPSGLGDYMNITVPITDVNEKPVIQNLPDDAYIVERSTGSFSVFDVSVIDVDAGDVLAYSITAWPDNAPFYITSSGELF